MNKSLRDAFFQNSWSPVEGLLVYLRENKCFSNGMSADKENTDANPYWYGSILNFNQLDLVIAELIENKSLKHKRLREIANSAQEDPNSPTVRLTGFSINRLLNK